MNVAAFAVVIARERVSEHGDDLASLENLGRAQPWLAWPMTIAMLSLAGFPATVGFIGKFYLIDASVARRLHLARRGDRDRLGDVARLLPARGGGDVDGPLRGRAARACRAPRQAGHGLVAGGRPRAQPEVALVAVLFAAATIFFGLWPDPLFDAARDVGTTFGMLR